MKILSLLSLPSRQTVIEFAKKELDDNQVLLGLGLTQFIFAVLGFFVGGFIGFMCLLVSMAPFAVVAYLEPIKLRAAKKLSDQKDQFIASLQTARQKADQSRLSLEKSGAAKSIFLANMGHELRTPINSIMGFAEVLHLELFGPLGNPKYKDYAHDIHQSGEYLLGMLNDILDISRIEHGGRTLSEVQIDLYRPLQQAQRMSAITAMRRNVVIQIDAFPGDIFLMSDQNALQQVAFNLLTNAIKHGPAGGVLILGAKRLEDGQAMLYVEDQGPGIPKDERLHVLAAFKRGRLALEKNLEGYGLGLSIVNGIMQQHGGRIEIEDAKPHGTIVSCIFPAKRVYTTNRSAWQNQAEKAREREDLQLSNAA